MQGILTHGLKVLNAGACHELVADKGKSQVPAAPGYGVNGYLSRKLKVQSHHKMLERCVESPSGGWQWPDRAEANHHHRSRAQRTRR